SFGTVGTFSFYATKNLTTGEGGMVVTDSDEVAQRVRQLVNHGRIDRYEHALLGYNYRMTDLAAAMGLAQLAKLEQFNLKRRANAVRLSRQLADVPGLVLPVERSEEHTSELQSRENLVCRLLLEKKKYKHTHDLTTS